MSTLAKQVIHMVWFKWPKVTPQQLTACQTAAENLKKIEGVLEVQFGTNFTDRSKGFNLGLFVRLSDKAALDFYAPHPIHEEFKATVTEREGTILPIELGVYQRTFGALLIALSALKQVQ